MARSTARAGPPQACSQWTLSSGRGSCSRSGGLGVLPGDGTQSSRTELLLLDGEAVLGGNHALVEAELLAGAVVAAKEREHSVEHGPDFVYLVGLVHGLVRLID